MQTFLEALAEGSVSLRRQCIIGELPVRKLVIDDIHLIPNKSLFKSAFVTLSRSFELSSLQLKFASDPCHQHWEDMNPEHGTQAAAKVLMAALSTLKTSVKLQVPSKIWLDMIGDGSYDDDGSGCLADIKDVKILNEDGDPLGMVSEGKLWTTEWPKKHSRYCYYDY